MCQLLEEVATCRDNLFVDDLCILGFNLFLVFSSLLYQLG